jgi:hypothetical protein
MPAVDEPENRWGEAGSASYPAIGVVVETKTAFPAPLLLLRHGRPSHLLSLDCLHIPVCCDRVGSCARHAPTTSSRSDIEA